MTRRHILLVYGTTYGQTARIAARIRDVLSARGHEVTLANASELPLGSPLQACDGVIVGASVIAHGHQKTVRQFVAEHRDELNRMPSAFFSVSASAASANDREREAATRLLDEFLESQKWSPALTASVAGAVNYTKYGRFLRWYMKRASRKGGGSTDTSRDHEYTDWAQVERFASQFGALLEGMPSTAHEAAVPT